MPISTIITDLNKAPILGTHLPASSVTILVQTVSQVSAMAMPILAQRLSPGKNRVAVMPAKRMNTEGCHSATLIHHSQAVRPAQRGPKARLTQA